MKILLFIFFIVIIVNPVQSQQENKNIDAGNNYYRNQEYDKAGAEYQKALQDNPANKVAKFNLANAWIRQSKLGDADKLLSELNVKENNNDIRSKSTYNQGVMLSQQKKLEESIELYKESLRLNPDDKEARENLQKALLELKKKNPPKKQEDKKKKDQQQQQKQQPKPKISQKEAQEQLKLLEQKEKDIQQRLQKNNSQAGGSQPKDW